MAHPALSPAEVFYPESDDQPMGETGIHSHVILNACGAIRAHYHGYRRRKDVYAVADMFLYYEEGNPRAVVAPDVFVVLGTHDEHRRTWKLWEEGQGPDFVLEVTSRSTRHEDLVSKREVYRSLGVKEYCQYDPLEEYLRPALQGLRLVGGEYEPMAPVGLEEGGLALYSAVLGLELRREEGERALRFLDPQTGASHVTPVEVTTNLEDTKARLDWSEAARQAAEARVEELEARLRTLQEGRDRAITPDVT